MPLMDKTETLFARWSKGSKADEEGVEAGTAAVRITLERGDFQVACWKRR